MKLLVLCLTVTLVTANTLVGSKRCAWGPSYWCSHINHAKECGAVNHCMTTVWKHQIIQPTSTGECLFCQMGFNELKDLLANQEIETDISKYVADVCKVLPDPDWKAMCNGIVTENLPILIQMLDSKLNSDMICATMGMCPGLEDTVSPYGVLAKDKVEVVKQSNTTCVDCTKFFQDVQQSITSKETEDELAQLVNQVLCNKIPSLTVVCKDLVNQVLPIALQFLADQLDPSITCRVFGFCETSRHTDTIPMKNIFKNLKRPLKYRSSEECDACKDFMGEVVDELRDNNTQASVLDFIKTDVCTSLGALASECNSLADQYVPVLFEFLVNELDPKTVCEMAGLCAVPTNGLTMAAAKLEPVRLISDGYKADSAPFCEICEFVMQEVDNVLKNKAIIKSVEDMIDKVCNKFPSDDLKKQCLAFVANNGQRVFDLLVEELDPKAICGLLKLCTVNLNTAFNNQKNAECDLCIIGIHEVEVLVANISTDKILTGVETLCAFLPSTNLAATCLTYVKQYLPLVISLLKGKEDPRSLCQLGGLCTSSVAHKPYMTRPIPEETMPVADTKSAANVKASEVCEVCNTAIFFLKQAIGNNATKEEIKAAVEALCQYIPAVYQSECQSLIAQYGDRIIELLLEHSGEICKEIGLCPSTISKTLGVQAGILSPVDTLPLLTKESEKVPVANTISTANDRASEVCELCNTAILILKEELGNNATKEEIKADLEELCQYVPASLQSECQSLIAQYGDQIIERLLEHSDEICKEIELCPSTISKTLGVQAGILSPVDTLPLLTKESEKESVIKANDENTYNVGVPVTCEVCKIAMSYLKNELGDNATEAEIRNALDSLCGKLPASFTTECTNLVNQYSDVIIQLLLKQIANPAQICKAIGLCSSTFSKTLGIQAGILSPVDTLPIITEEGVKGQDSSKKTDIGKSATTCKVCYDAMIAVLYVLKNPGTEAALNTELEKFCNYLPSSDLEVCKNLVQEYGNELIDLLLDEIDPSLICERIELCSSTFSKVPSIQAGILSPVDTLPIVTDEGVKAQKALEGVDCEACTFILTAADKALQQKTTQDALKEAILGACKELGSSSQAMCEGLVNKYFQMVINYIILSESPASLCKELKFCTAMAASKQAGHVKLSEASPKNVNSDGECVICKLAMGELENILEKNATTAKIEAALEKVCSLLPTTISTECKDFVAKYSKEIIALLEQEASPAEICKLLKLCTADKLIGLQAMVKILPQKGNIGADFCAPCKEIVVYIKTLLKENATQDDIIAYLETICDILPDTVTAQCEDVMKQYVPAIIAFIQQDLSPEQICMQLKFCNSTSLKTDDKLYFHPRAKVLGAEKCTYGPSFWCASEENAKRCNAEEHCRRHVWNK